MHCKIADLLTTEQFRRFRKHRADFFLQRLGDLLLSGRLHGSLLRHSNTFKCCSRKCIVIVMTLTVIVIIIFFMTTIIIVRIEISIIRP